jgi:hypothetical protein
MRETVVRLGARVCRLRALAGVFQQRIDARSPSVICRRILRRRELEHRVDRGERLAAATNA